jgi:hypothetical protein
MSRASTKRRKGAKPAKSSRDKVRAYRARMRARGLRPVQMWLPDINSEAFRREAARQSRLVRESPGEKETMDFIEAITDWPDR